MYVTCNGIHQRLIGTFVVVWLQLNNVRDSEFGVTKKYILLWKS